MRGLRTLIFDVSDLSGAKAFYEKVLGKAPYFDQPFYVGFDVEGYELGLRPSEGDKKEGIGGATAYLGTDDLDAELARVVAHGATVREPAEDVGDGIRVATILDPFGNQLGLIQNRHFAPTLVSAGADDLSPRAIVHERVVPASRETVYGLFTSSEGLKKWLVDAAKVELRPGGAYEIYFMTDAPAGTQGSETCRVLSFIPGRMVSFTWNAPPHLSRTRNQHTWVVVEFEGDASTKVRVTHTGWPASGLASEPEWEATFAYFDRAWQGVLGALETYARTGRKA